MSDPLARLRRFLRELKRRNVYKVAVAYIAVAFVVLQGARLLVPALVLPEWFYRVVVALALLGFPLALVVAWAFELTPEGMRRTETPGGGGAEGSTAYQWLGLTLVVLLAGGVWYATTGDEGEKPARGTAAATDTAQAESTVNDRSIAVLPFDNLSDTEEAEPFVNGLHDDLLTRLSNISDLKVISRTSVLPYRQTELSLPAIADSLGVTWIVEGGVQQAGDQVQVNTQLIQAEEDAHRWAETYQRELTTENLFAVQSELTKRIARSLEAQLSPSETHRVERQPTQDLQAYRLYVQGRGFLDRRTEAGMRTAIEHFQRALQQDSTYGQAWAGLAEAQAQLGGYGHAPLDSLLPWVSEAATRALRLDPEIAEAHAAAGLVPLYRHNAPAALHHLRRALELKPSLAEAHRFIGYLMHVLGRSEAIKHARRAVELNPMTPEAHAVLGRELLARGKAREALRHAQRGQEITRDYDTSHFIEVVALYQLGRLEEVISVLSRKPNWPSSEPASWMSLLAVSHLAAGDTARARQVLGQLQATDDHFFVGVIHAAFGQRDQAFRALQQVDRWTADRTILLRHDYWGVLAPLRDDPRYQRLVRAANVAWGLNPDGSLPDSVDVSFDPPADE